MFSAPEHVAELDANITAVAAEYGEGVAKAVEEIFYSILSMHVLLTSVDEPLLRLVLIDVAVKNTARVCRLCEKAFGLTVEQVTEALNIAKEMHSNTTKKAKAAADEENKV